MSRAYVESSISWCRSRYFLSSERFTQLFSTLIFDFRSDNDELWVLSESNWKSKAFHVISLSCFGNLPSSNKPQSFAEFTRIENFPHVYHQADEYKRTASETTEVIEISLLELSIAQAEWTFEASAPALIIDLLIFFAVNFNFLCARCTLNSTYHVRKMLATLHEHLIRAWVDPIISHRMVTKRSGKLFNNSHIDESNQLPKKIFHLAFTKDVFLQRNFWS